MFMHKLFRNKGLINQLKKRAITVNKTSTKKIVFADTDEVVIKACSLVAKEKIAKPIIVGSRKEIMSIVHKLKIKNISEDNILDHLSEQNKEQLKGFVDEYIEIRKSSGKIVSSEDATTKISQSNYYAAMMLHRGMVDGMISGSNSKTKPYYPAFEIIKTREGINKSSGVFIMADKGGKHTYFFADCALSINPTAEELAEIALTTADTVINFGIKPKIAMLSFSTRDSAKHEMVDKVKNATKIVKEKNSGLDVDGEIQLDAAIVPEVMRKKCSDSPLEGQANVLIFPDLNAGNIGYKLVERLGKYKAVGPIMQGLNKPVNDLSRGSSVEDIVDLTAITVIQSLE